MSRVYVYPPDCEDFSTLGLCGALTPTSCYYDEMANGMAELTLTHPLDGFGRYDFLRENSLLKAEVPVRTTPEIENGEYVTSVEQWTVKATATKAERYIYSKQEAGYKRKLLSAGTSVTVTSVPADSERWKIKAGKTTGWIAQAALESRVTVTIPATPEGIEAAAPSWETREQLFRIYNVDASDDGVTVYAQHLTYDLMYNVTTFDTDEEIELQDALDGILNACLDEHPFRAYTDIKGARVGVHARDENPIKAMLDPEEGAAARWNAQAIRDNEEIYLLSRAGMNRGVRIEYAKNLLGVNMTIDVSDATTHIRPVGETKNGDPLYLDGDGLVESKLAKNYPFKRIHVLKCEGCKVDKNVTTSLAKQRMQEQAQAMLDGGADMPTVNAMIEFVRLGSAARYAQYREMQKVFLFDTVTVWHPVLKIDMPADVVRIRWDCLLDEMESMEIGDLRKLVPSVASWQIPGGINGGKIASNTLTSRTLADDTISARHVQAESINTDALQASSVTADKLAAGAVTADKLEAGSISAKVAEFVAAKIGSIEAKDIETNELYAAFAHIIELAAGSISAGQIDVDRLAAALAEVVSLQAATGDFDLATIQNLLANALILQQGQAGSMQIINLAVTSANILNATLGELVLKGEDGRYYRVFVGSNGEISTETATVTGDEIAAGKTQAGNAIVGTSANIADLNAQTVKAASAIISTVFTEALTAGKITAGEALIASATIPELYVTAIKAIGDSIDISANETIRLLLGTDENIKRWFRFDEDGMTTGKPGSTYSTRTDDTGFHIQQLGEAIGSFSKRTMAAENVRIGKVNTFEPRCILREAPDGGMMIALEGLV